MEAIWRVTLGVIWLSLLLGLAAGYFMTVVLGFKRHGIVAIFLTPLPITMIYGIVKYRTTKIPTLLMIGGWLGAMACLAFV